MPRASNAAIVAATDQYRAIVDQLVTHTAAHLETCPNPTWDCPGHQVSRNLDRLDREELRVIAEIALVKLARQKAANAIPAHWCRECQVAHA